MSSVWMYVLYMKTTRDEKLSKTATLALDFVRSAHKTWGDYCVEHGLGYHGSTPEAWSVRMPSHRTYESLAAKGLIRVVNGVYVTA